MLAARLYGKEDIKIEEIKEPQINRNEILVKVKSAFICGTDVRMYKNGHKAIKPNCPLTLGHELSGIVAQAGSKVNGYKEGQQVTVAPNIGCGICNLCMRGNTHLCENYKALGISLDGAFAEYVKIPEAAITQGNVMIYDRTTSFKEAALVEPLSCVYSAFERTNIKPGDTVLIIGAGPIGIMHAKLAKTAGASKIMINDLIEKRLLKCKEIDNSFITIPAGNLKETIMHQTDGLGVDVCITACPTVAAQEISLELMAVNGRVIFFGGLPAGKKANLDTNIIHYRQLTVSGTTRASVVQFKKALDLISCGSVEVKSLVTSSYLIKDFRQALEMVLKGIGLKTEIVFNENDMA